MLDLKKIGFVSGWRVRAGHVEDQVAQVRHRGRHHDPAYRRHDQTRVGFRQRWPVLRQRLRFRRHSRINDERSEVKKKST